MLNIEKFLNNFKVTIQGGIKMVHEWTNEGEGDFANVQVWNTITVALM